MQKVLAKSNGLITRGEDEVNIRDLIKLYEEKRKIYGDDTYQYISKLLNEAKKIHHEDWLKSPTPSGDHEQSGELSKGKTTKNWSCT